MNNILKSFLVITSIIFLSGFANKFDFSFDNQNYDKVYFNDYVSLLSSSDTTCNLDYPEGTCAYYLGHADEDNEDLIKHSPERSLIALCYFVSYFQYQALLEYGWLIRGAVTCGSLYLTQTRSAQLIRQSGQNENSEVDFIWGGALVRAYTLQKEERYPRVIFDTEVSRYLEETFPQHVRIFQSFKMNHIR